MGNEFILRPRFWGGPNIPIRQPRLRGTPTGERLRQFGRYMEARYQSKTTLPEKLNYLREEAANLQAGKFDPWLPQAEDRHNAEVYLERRIRRLEVAVPAKRSVFTPNDFCRDTLKSFVIKWVGDLIA